MKVIEHLDRATKPLISFEIIPPLRGGNVQKLLLLIDDLVRYKPPFIDITSHAAQVIYQETTDGIRRVIKRKRPGTLGLCALVQNKYDVDAVPHVLCQGFTCEETEDFLIEIKYLGIDNVLAIKGDDNGYQKPVRPDRSINEYAIDLVEQIVRMNRGVYLENEQLVDAEPSSFCVGVAGYPEKHFEAPNNEIDVRYTKAKVDAGGEYIVTQMFFNNAHYFDYLARCRAAGIEVPIIPGIKILTSKRQVKSLPRLFHCEIPADLADEVEAAPAEHVSDIGVEWARRQTEELLAKGVPSVHFYVMQSSEAVCKLLDNIDL
ncbi:MAG: methylenetetrahydrofolate reductase [Acidobacteriota bacterium]|nr:methylenetetrahydrofolate reductase [Acidobacteriota bacterium]